MRNLKSLSGFFVVVAVVVVVVVVAVVVVVVAIVVVVCLFIVLAFAYLKEFLSKRMVLKVDLFDIRPENASCAGMCVHFSAQTVSGLGQ